MFTFPPHTIFHSLNIFLFHTRYQYFVKVKSLRKLFAQEVLKETNDPEKSGLEKIIRPNLIIMCLYSSRAEQIWTNKLSKRLLWISYSRRHGLIVMGRGCRLPHPRPVYICHPPHSSIFCEKLLLLTHLNWVISNSHLLFSHIFSFSNIWNKAVNCQWWKINTEC